MPSILDLCEKYFETKDIYGLLGITKDSIEKDIKKAYYKLSLKVHPDRVPEDEKELATEKFKILAKIHEVLTDKNRKALYDEKGIIDDEDDEGKLSSWLELWRQIFKPITTEDIDNYQKEFIGSELERQDIKKAYLNGKGCINYMMNVVPFMSVESEPRIQEIVKNMISSGEVPEYKIFTNEPKTKTNRRHKKYAKEVKKSEEIQKKMDKKGNGSLEQQIMARQQERVSLFDRLISRYEDVDDSEEFKLEDLGKSKRKSNSKKGKQNKKEEVKSKDHKVKNGRVSKKRSSKA